METEKAKLGFEIGLDKFFEGWVRKDIQPLRKKGIWVDKIYEWLQEHPNTYQGVKEWGNDYAGYHEVYYSGVVDGIQVRYTWCSARMGMPSLYIGTQTQKEWIDIRTKLKAEGLIR